MFRQYLTILIIILFNTITVFAQKTVTRLEYEKAVDNLNCEVAKYYIERNQGTYELEAYNDSIARFGCNFEHLMVFLKERHLQMEQNAYLAEYIEQLKKEYDLLVMNTSLYDRMVDVFKEDALKVYEPREDYQAFKKIYSLN
ncbi:MAG: hypothetical protein HC803_00545 [Saprospiraceae bacterium]|nr:hypothetical protein [Saprospiraceae bacterium]